MNNRVLFLGWLICSTAVCALPASSGEAGCGGPGGGASQIETGQARSDAGQTPSGPLGNLGGTESRVPTDETNRGRRSVLESVTALDRPVSVTETKIPLGELVKQVAEETGVGLTAAREVADEPVAVAVKEMPAGELLEQLAVLLDYQWSRQGRAERMRYEIGQDLASRQREEALRQAEFGQVEKRFREELERYGEIATLSQGQLQRLLEAEEQRQQELARLSPQQREVLDRRPEQRERSQRFRAARELFSPVSRTLVVLLKRLSPQQWTLLRAAGQITFSTEPEPGELRLPEEVGRIFHASSPGTYRPGVPGAARDAGAEEWVRQSQRAMQEQWAAATGYRVTIRLAADRLPMGGSFSLKVEAKPVDSAAPSKFSLVGAGPGTSLFLSVDPEDLQPPAAADPPPPRAELENDPALSARKRFRLEAKRHASELESSPGLRIEELLPDLARTYGVQFIADAYWASPSYSASEVPTGEPIALSAVLDRLAGSSHLWDRVSTKSAGTREVGGDSLVRLRSRKWFFDRVKEVPLRLVRQWRELADRYGALPLETYLEMATSLNDGQLASLGNLVNEGALPDELQDLYTIHSARSALRLYGSLSSRQRQTLWQGKAIPMTPLTPAQRDLLVAALQEPGRSEPTTLEQLPLAVAGLSLTAERWVQCKEQRRESLRYWMEPAIVLAAPPGARETPVTPGGGRSRPTTVAGAAPPAPPSDRVVVTRHPVTRIRLQFHCGPVAQEIVCLTIGSPTFTP